MKVIKAINNNNLCVLDEHGKEQIVSGKGIGFGKKYGDMVEVSQIQKTYRTICRLHASQGKAACAFSSGGNREDTDSEDTDRTDRLSFVCDAPVLQDGTDGVDKSASDTAPSKPCHGFP